uniref:Uncharacterized protein n=2 Tax=Lotharella globosa TaxID=91324 RepID=A0A6U3BQ36_9EUKA
MSFLWKYLTDSLSWLGLYNKSARILFLGLDNAGKTTLLHRLRDGKLVSHAPTRYPQKEELQLGGVTFTTHDLGGHKAARKVWKEYMTAIDGIVYMVDVADTKRLSESKKELHKLLTDLPAKCPFLILGNKIDIASISESQCKEALGITQLATGKTGKPSAGIRPLEIFMCSVVKEAGYPDGFKWLANLLD